MDPAAVGAAVRQVLGDALGYLYPAALRVAVRVGVADHLTDGPLPVERLAALCGVQPDHLRRVLRFLATRDVFREDEDGAFHLTTAASLLRSGSPLSVRSTVLLLTDEMYWLPTGRLEDTVRKGTTIFNDIFGSPLFDYLAGDEERAQIFHTGIADLSTMEQDGIADSYRFADAGTVIDVAGGPGGFLQAVLRRNPRLRGVLFDDESVLREHRLTDPRSRGAGRPWPGTSSRLCRAAATSTSSSGCCTTGMMRTACAFCSRAGRPCPIRRVSSSSTPLCRWATTRIPASSTTSR